MLPNFAGLLEYVDVFLAELGVGMRGIMRIDQLRQTKSASHARRPAADDDNVSGHLRALDAFNWFSKDDHKLRDQTLETILWPFLLPLSAAARYRTGFQPPHNLQSQKSEPRHLYSLQ